MRIKISEQDSELIKYLTPVFKLKNEGLLAKIAFSISLQSNKKFNIGNNSQLNTNGKKWRDENALFGLSPDNKSYHIVYKAILQKYYNQNFNDEEFISLFKNHLNDGLTILETHTKKANATTEYHTKYLLDLIKTGLGFINYSHQILISNNYNNEIKACDTLIKLTIGKDLSNNDITLSINDLNEYDSCNIAIAGMAGSGKTEFVKDILYQISLQTDKQLKFIFFDYKGDGDETRLSNFFQTTGSKMIDLKKEAMELNPLSFINLNDKRIRDFNIKSFIDFICNIATQLGSIQKNILYTVINKCFDDITLSENLHNNDNPSHHPTLLNVFNVLKTHYTNNNLKQDSLFAIISDLAQNIFTYNNIALNKKIYSESLYINLPIELSDTLRQLCVFLTLKYLLSEFSSTNDTEPNENRIKPLRYIIVIDEAHVYLKNKNASKALEDILRILRSKGVVIIMLSQGVEDYKTKNFDFTSQIKISICLNVNNKDYKLIESFVGTPRSKQKLQEAIGNLAPQMGLINIIEPKIIQINQFWKTMSK